MKRKNLIGKGQGQQHPNLMKTYSSNGPSLTGKRTYYNRRRQLLSCSATLSLLILLSLYVFFPFVESASVPLEPTVRLPPSNPSPQNEQEQQEQQVQENLLNHHNHNNHEPHADLQVQHQQREQQQQQQQQQQHLNRHQHQGHIDINVNVNSNTEQEYFAKPRPLAAMPPPSSATATISLNGATSTLSTATIEAGSNDSSKKLLVQQQGSGPQPQSDLEVEAEETTSPKTLMLIRLLFITYYGSLGALMPYLPVYFHSLGHGGQAIGLLGAVKPLTTFIVAPLWGVISDYYQNPSMVLQLTFITSLVLQLLLPLRDEVRYLVGMVFLTALFNAPVKSLIDSMVMNQLSAKDRGQYGKLRLWGQLGFGLGSSIVGYTISKSVNAASPMPTSPAPVAEHVIHNAMDIAIEGGASAAASEEVTKKAIQTISDLVSNSIEKLRNVQGYKLAFLAYGFMSIPAFLAMKSFQKINQGGVKAVPDSAINNAVQNKKKGESPKILQGINMLLHHGDALLFFFLVLVVGITSGIIENFAYVRIREVGGTGKEMGLCRLTSSLCGAPMFWFSGPLTSLLGADRVLVMTLVSYIFRFLNYAFMRHPYHALPAEAMRGIAFAAFWSTGTVFAHKISPPGMNTTMLMFMNAMYGGLGQSAGAIIGGKLQSIFGTTKTFLYSALADFIFVCTVSAYIGMRADSSFKNPKPITLKEYSQKEE